MLSMPTNTKQQLCIKPTGFLVVFASGSIIAFGYKNLWGSIISLLVCNSCTFVNRKSGSLHPTLNDWALLLLTFVKSGELKCATKMSIAYDITCKDILSSDLRACQESRIDSSCSDHSVILLFIPPTTGTGMSCRSVGSF